MQIPTEELPRRRPVWEALSDLFLDTEVDDRSIDWIAKVLVASGYSDAELEGILWNEVCPALYENLLSPAGVWEGFKVEFVEKRIVELRTGRWTSLAAYYLGGRMVEADWKRVQASIATRRAL